MGAPESMTPTVTLPRPERPRATRGGPGPRVDRWLRAARADWTLLFVAAFAVGVVLRVRMAMSAPGAMDSDQAVVYLMAKRAASGDLEPYYWGQGYGGTLTAIGLGALFRLVGAHYWLLPAVVGGTGLALVLAVRAVAARVAGRRAGNLAGALLALGPPGLLKMTLTNEAGFYGLGMLLCVVALLLAIRLRDRPTAWTAAAVGFVAGLACWTSPFSYLGLVPAAVVLLGTVLRRVRLVLPLGAGALPGGVLVLEGLSRRLATAEVGTASDRLEGAISTVWPTSLTILTPLPAETSAGALLSALMFAVATVMVLLRTVRRRDRYRTGLWLAVAVWPAFIAWTGVLTDVWAWRYGVIILPSVALLLAASSARPRVAQVVLAAWAVVFAGGLLVATDGLAPRPCPLFSAANRELTALLASDGRSAVWADYWIAYRLSAESDERVVADPVAVSRDPEYGRLASEAARSTVVVFADSRNDLEMTAFVAGRADVERTVLQHYAVYRFAGQLSRAELPAMPSTDITQDPPVAPGSCGSGG